MSSSSITLILDNCIEDIRSGRATIQECREHYAQQWSELEPLLHLGLRLQQARQVQVSPEYRLAAAARMRNLVAAYPRSSAAALITTKDTRVNTRDRKDTEDTRGREVVYAVPADQRGGQEGRFAGWRMALGIQRILQKRLAGMATALVVLVVMLLAGTVTAYASAQSLPGDVLYPLKTKIETARLALSSTEAGDARLHMLFATRRLEEVTALLERNQPGHVQEAFEDYVVHVTLAVEGLEKSVAAPSPEHDNLARMLAVELAGQQGQLATLLVDVPETTLTANAKDALQEAAESALTASQEGEARVWALIDELPGIPGPGTPPAATGTAMSAPATGTPTPVPTAPPTRTPSPSPSSTAAATSTARPTATETRPQRTPEGPHGPPSATPVGPAAPTPISIDLPTDVPKEWLTRIATRWPTAIPTTWPTAWPTGVPTAWPTGWPTEVPTGWPTGEPTEWSTGWPTEVPTWWPTEVPTAWPVEVPTEWPTALPIPIPIPLPPLPDLPPAPPGW